MNKPISLTRFCGLLIVAAIAVVAVISTYAQTNLGLSGTAYRWAHNLGETSNANRAAAPKLNDNNSSADVNLSGGAAESTAAYEAGGLIWATPQTVDRVEFINGTWQSSGDGAFSQGLKLQTTLDGTTWTNSSWSVSPAYAYDSSLAAGKAYLFSGPLISVKGIRVSGRLHTTSASSYWANLREIRAFAPNPPLSSTTIWNPTDTPTTVDASDAQPVELGVRFRTTTAGQIKGIRFYKAVANTGIHLGSLWASDGTLLAQASFLNETPSGWQQGDFASPVSITPGVTYIASYHTTAGHYSADSAYFSSSGHSKGPLQALPDGVDGGNGCYNYAPSSAFPGQTWNATNYWVDVSFVVPSGADTTSPTPPTQLTAVALSPSQVQLSWAASTDDRGISRYQLFRNGSGVPFAETDALTYIDSSVLENTTYLYQVRAIDTSGNSSSLSVTAQVTTPSTTVPSAPVGLVAYPGNAQVILSWNAVSEATSYHVYRNHTLVSAAPSPSYVNTGLINDTNYGYEVSAVNNRGESPRSGEVFAMPTATGHEVTHGSELTLGNVGPTGLGISTFTTVPGGVFNGTALTGWSALARTVGTGGEIIDGFAFPPGTVVLQGANVTSTIDIESGWLVLRGCKGGGLHLNHPIGNGGGAAALYCDLNFFDAVGRQWGRQPAVSIVHRCYFHQASGLENVYADNTTVTESWISVSGGAPGDHVDGIQTWGGQSYLNFSRNHLEWNGPANGTQSGLIAMYSDGSQNGYSGYDHVTVQNNIILIGNGGGQGIHAPMGVSTAFVAITGNRWTWIPGSDPDYTPAIYKLPGQEANYKTNNNTWSDNRWIDGPYANQFLWPDDTTHMTEY